MCLPAGERCLQLIKAHFYSVQLVKALECGSAFACVLVLPSLLELTV
jgi:hypothetical protein